MRSGPKKGPGGSSTTEDLQPGLTTEPTSTVTDRVGVWCLGRDVSLDLDRWRGGHDSGSLNPVQYTEVRVGEGSGV